MNINELAAMLGSDFHRLTRMAKRGEIPSQMIRGEFRFNFQQICFWLQQVVPFMAYPDLVRVDTGLSQYRGTSFLTPLVGPLLQTPAMTSHLDARTQCSVKRKLVSLADNTENVYDNTALLDNLTCDTLPCGVTLLHPNRALPYALAEPVLAMAKTLAPVLFDRNIHTNLFFLCAAQDLDHHVHILTRLCRLLQDQDLIDHLNQAQTPADMIEAITDAEENVVTCAV
jgi:mannitol/fructose-specific phosphotransferase system IIA component (Ntr-type)